MCLYITYDFVAIINIAILLLSLKSVVSDTHGLLSSSAISNGKKGEGTSRQFDTDGLSIKPYILYSTHLLIATYFISSTYIHFLFYGLTLTF